MSVILTIDAGTTSLKGAAFDPAGNVLACRIHEYALEYPAPDLVELDPEVCWQAAKTVMAGLLRDLKTHHDAVAAIGVTSQGETLIVLDRRGRPLRKAIVWLDNRAKNEADVIRRKFGQKQVYQITGQENVLPCWPAAKLLWLRKNEPAVFKAACNRDIEIIATFPSTPPLFHIKLLSSSRSLSPSPATTLVFG